MKKRKRRPSRCALWTPVQPVYEPRPPLLADSAILEWFEARLIDGAAWVAAEIYVSPAQLAQRAPADPLAPMPLVYRLRPLPSTPAEIAAKLSAARLEWLTPAGLYRYVLNRWHVSGKDIPRVFSDATRAQRLYKLFGWPIPLYRLARRDGDKIWGKEPEEEIPS